MSAPVWEEPPPVIRGRRPLTDYEAAARLARTRPGQWLRLPGDYPLASGTRIRHGRVRGFREGKWEVNARATEPGNLTRVHIWVRYIGPQDG